MSVEQNRKLKRKFGTRQVVAWFRELFRFITRAIRGTSNKATKRRSRGNSLVVFRTDVLEVRLLNQADIALTPNIATLAASFVSTENSETTDVERSTNEIAFVNSNVPDLNDLLANLTQKVSSPRRLKVVVIDASTDGFPQIGAALRGQTGLTAIHFLSHGDGEGVQFGSTWLTQADLSEHSSHIIAWRSALAPNADLMFYACDLAQNSTGQSLLKGIDDLIGGTGVAGSTALTGNVANGGDWNLEYSIGEIQTPTVLSDTTASNWDGVLSTFTVSNTGDSGAGSLRQAITDANATAGPHTIQFNLSTGDSNYNSTTQKWTISPSSALPSLIQQVALDGTSQSGWTAGNPVIELNGTSAGASVNGLTLSDGSDGSTVRGFIINRFSTSAIRISSGADGNTIAGNWLGTDTSGSAVATGNGAIGIDISSINNTIGGVNAADRNVIGGFQTVAFVGGRGINVTGGSNTIVGNYIGIGADGSTTIGNLSGILITDASSTIIGGSSAGARNVISGNTGVGITVQTVSGTTSGTSILGNYVGLDAGGTLDRGNTSHGINIAGSASNTTIGGSVAGAGNVISGNDVAVLSRTEQASQAP